jgi:hypothetical protein
MGHMIPATRITSPSPIRKRCTSIASLGSRGGEAAAKDQGPVEDHPPALHWTGNLFARRVPRR